MHIRIGTGIRISALATALALVAACGSAPAPHTTQGTAVSDIVATVPDAPAANLAPVSGPKLAPNQSITINKAIWDDYQAYLTRVGRIGDGFYAVTQDGQGGASWSCGEAFCQGTFDGQGAALKQCEASNPGKTCLIFAKDSRIQVKYEVAQ